MSRRRALVPLLLAAAVLWPLFGCRGSLRLEPSDADRVLDRHALDAPDPSRPGPHEVRFLYYGSGTDRRRPEYRDSVTIVTETVDASKLVDLGESAEERNGYWGFSPDSFPVNARVWYPAEGGPHPLVLIVHGNHDMKEFSDPGYGYLGRLLASRGFILASVDMNFLNGSIDQENDARGWMLLQHLRAWRGFDAEEGGPFQGKVDMGRIALIGHSRGGEAVANAAAFNRLPRYPDDASLEFDFGFEIRSVVAIAPVDGQYLPTDRLVPFRDVNYMVFHGSHDGDVTSFHGLRPWDRLELTEGADRFKTAIYVYRANHGQWNTVWGAHDNGPRSPRILDLRGLIPGEDQRRFARIYIPAFLEATLRDDRRYLPLFRDHRVAGDWLPKTMYVTRLEHASFRALATFEEDIDVTSGTAPGVGLLGEDLATWKEGTLQLRSSNRATTSASQDNQGVWLGWNRRIRGADTLAAPATYSVTLPADLPRRWGLGPGTTLDLHLSGTEEVPPPRTPEGEDGGAEPSSGIDSAEGEPDRWEFADDRPPLDLTVEVVDAAGRSARVTLSRYGPVRYPLEMSILRRKDLEEERFPRFYEVLLQSYHIPLGDFAEGAGGPDLRRLRTVRLVFDRTEAGTVVVDDLGFSRMGEPFLEARLGGGTSRQPAGGS
ncbi:MAG TPA: hypothetical protein VLL48_03095 [Longimicrobiales bacterium]|nr:hypothetical protein [Longimicrobiales bacterium]